MTAKTVPSPPEIYEQFYGPAIFSPLAAELLRLADPRPGEHVLDLACGTGIAAREAARRVHPGGRVLAVDINPGMLRVASGRPVDEGAPIEWLQGDAVEVELPAGAFDLALCQQGLQFFSDPAAALRVAHRALAPEGRMALAVWEGPDRQSLVVELAAIEAAHLEPLGVGLDDMLAPFSLGDADRLRSLLEEAGFSRVSMEQHTVEASFPSPDTFLRNMETAYAAVIPAFAEDGAAFEDFVRTIEREGRELVRRYTVGDRVRADMPTHLVLAER